MLILGRNSKGSYLLRKLRLCYCIFIQNLVHASLCSSIFLLIIGPVRGLSQIIFPTVSVIMTLRGGGGGWESEGVTLTNQAFFFSQEEGWPLPEKTLEGDHRCCKKALHPKHYAEVLATEGNSWRSSSR